ncbi:MAG: hypothetical protein WC346_04585 [Methanogenium sp.]|jgi:transcription initiation factor IIE alpha subunit
MVNEESVNNLEEYYKHIYICEKCKMKYGSDKEEKLNHICPVCDGSYKR